MNKKELKEMLEQARSRINDLEYLSGNMSVLAETHSGTITRLTRALDAQQSELRHLRHCINEISEYFESAKRNIALEIVLHGTHRMRDAFYEDIVREMDRIQDAYIQSPPRDMDDIPF